jgi:hypothetical protein
MIVDFYTEKGDYLTEVELSDNDVKILTRYAILDIIKKTAKEKPSKVNDFLDEINKLGKIKYNKDKKKN